MAKAATHKVGEYGLASKFPGYRAREDQTTLDRQTLIAPSQNVVLNPSGRVALVQGYTLDGAGSAVIDSGILSNFDFTPSIGAVRNLRAGSLTSAGNDGKLQYRYVDALGVVNWVTLKSALTNVRLSFCNWWDNTALVKNVIWVDGSNNIFNWNGAVTTLASATSNTITNQGSLTWAQLGFSATGSVVIGGVSATYSGGSGSQTLTGVSVDFSASPAASIVHQAVITTALSGMTAIPATFGPTLVGCGRNNQLYVGASNSNVLYISKVNNFTDFSFTAKARIAGEGWTKTLDAPPIAFVPLEDRSDVNASDLYISQGSDVWGMITASIDISFDSSGVAQNTVETLQYVRLMNAPLQGAKSSRLVGKMKNHIVFVGYDNVANFMGWISYQEVPETVDFSYPIINDMNAYDFTDGSVFYHRNYLYIAIPKAGVIRVYNMTDQSKQTTMSVYHPYEDVDVANQPWFWEAPITYPLSGFYVVNGEIYGHSYTTSESYKLFNGGSFNTQQIEANATFAFDDKGDRTQSKGSNELWIEGYIKQNTLLTATVAGDLNNFQTTQTVIVNGNDSAIVAYGSGAHALGKNNLGSQPLGGAQISASTLPAWFHVAKTYPQVGCYLEQLSFASKGVDLQWELICFGTNATMTAEGNNSITE